MYFLMSSQQYCRAVTELDVTSTYVSLQKLTCKLVCTHRTLSVGPTEFQSYCIFRRSGIINEPEPNVLFVFLLWSVVSIEKKNKCREGAKILNTSFDRFI